jgi:hypothetical protein
VLGVHGRPPAGVPGRRATDARSMPQDKVAAVERQVRRRAWCPGPPSVVQPHPEPSRRPHPRTPQRRKSRWRRLNPGRQALLSLAHLRNGDTYTRLAAGFRIGVATAWRYVQEAIALPSAAPDDLATAMRRIRLLAYVILDGTLTRSTASPTRSPTPTPRDRDRAGHPRAASRRSKPLRRLKKLTGGAPPTRRSCAKRAADAFHRRAPRPVSSSRATSSGSWPLLSPAPHREASWP